MLRRAKGTGAPVVVLTRVHETKGGFMRRLAKVATVAALPFFLLGATEGRAPAGPVTFTIDKADYASACDWAATGAIVDSGSCGLNADHVQLGRSATFSVLDEIAGQDGSITWEIHLNYAARPLGDGLYTTQGAWRIVAGTGDYAGISGQGSIAGTFNGATGELHNVHSGTIMH